MYTLDFNKPDKIHFTGIGGISMSAIAELLNSRGFTITGSDDHNTPIIEHLRSLGINIEIGLRASNIPADASLVVYTVAIKLNNPELSAAAAAGIPMLTRAQLLGQIMLNYKDASAVTGTHGKTTTTSMLSLILLEAGFDPTIMVGGVLDNIKGNLRSGRSEHMVMEACEYTNSFLEFCPAHAIILNIEAEHLDFFKDIQDIRHSFRRFAELVPANGNLVINHEIDNYQEITSGLKCNIITYSTDNSDADYYARDIEFTEDGFGIYSLYHKGQNLGRIHLEVVGLHNVSNSLAAIALALTLGATFENCANALLKYHGAKRRFEKKGMIGGVQIVDDYAHHPSEIRATLTAAHSCNYKRIWCVFQPHTYSRTKALLGDFADALSLADEIVLTDIYPARETDPGDISSADLAERLASLGNNVHHFHSFDEIENFLLENCCEGDLLITMGAGDVDFIGKSLLGEK